MRTLFILVAVFCVSSPVFAATYDEGIGTAYDPLLLPDSIEPETVDVAVSDIKRDREIPIRVYLPVSKEPAAVILFSHGLGGSRNGCSYLGRHWAGRGYAAVFMQHIGSDTSVWKDKPVAGRMTAMQKAANSKNFMLRVNDVKAVIDRLEQWNKTDGHPLAARLNTNRIGMSGHSFGAVTTQAVSGQRFVFGKSLYDPRIKAAVAFSPSGPRGNKDPLKAFGQVAVPWLLMTGTNDIALIGGADLASRLAVYPALPPDGKYELVLDGAQHSAFTDHALPGDTEIRNSNHHRVILALSTAFWDAYLNDSAAAKEWLDGDGPRSVMQEKDRWQRK